MSDEQLPNPYRAAIKSARSTAVPKARELAEALKDARTAFAGNCWMSETASTFHNGLVDQIRRLEQCQTDALQDFDDAIAAQPEKVDLHAWQMRWHQSAR